MSTLSRLLSACSVALTVALGACAPASPPPATAVPTVVPTATPGPTAKTPRTTGTVQRIEGERVSLTDGKSFLVTPASRVNRVQLADVSALKPGMNVGATIEIPKSGPSVAVSVHIVNPERPFTAGQNPPLASTEDVMTNSTVEALQGTKLTLRLPGGTVEAELPAGTPVVTFLEPGSAADIRVGAWISAVVSDGVGVHVYAEYK